MGARPTPPTVNCPTCGDLVDWTEESRWRPFCSERCRLLDLGAWFDEERAIPDSNPAPVSESSTEAE